MSYQLVKVFGLQRSGNHAILNWLIGLDVEKTLFINNQKAGRPLRGGAVSLPDEFNANAKRHNGRVTEYSELVSSFSSWGNKLIVSFENFDLRLHDPATANGPIYNAFGPPDDERIVLILRNPFCVIPSLSRLHPIDEYEHASRIFRQNGLVNLLLYTAQSIRRLAKRKPEAHSLHARGRVVDIIELWPEYANAASSGKIGRNPVTPIIFDRWLKCLNYRNSIATTLGCTNEDKYMDFISDAGGGSSFYGTSANASELSGYSCIERWNFLSRKKKVVKVIKNNPDFLRLSRELFPSSEIPPVFR
ncbi:hypothetical protein [Wenzhouxiangella sp. EGI_FJ10305]|uniref:hypothetical protein n=1 Tax=Wenzhouxiangella sp. EGI_FJ10305 TaxID=3243768 RepID=UPI0035DD6ECB